MKTISRCGLILFILGLFITLEASILDPQNTTSFGIYVGMILAAIGCIIYLEVNV